MDRFLDILNSVKKKDNATFSSCEPELIELMRKIDEMIDLKNKEWKNDTAILEEQLADMHYKNQILNQEGERLKTLLSEEKKSHSFTLSQYEKDVKHLKDDMARLKHKYTDLQKKIEHAKRKRQQESNLKTRGKESTTPLSNSCGKKENPIVLSKTDNNLTEKCSDLEKENLILKLKLESVMIENSNLRCMLREQSEPFVWKKEKSILSETTGSTENSTLIDNDDSIHIFGRSTQYQDGSVSSNRHKLTSDRTSSYQKSNSDSLEYFEDDQNLEDKLNNVISQFETVSSSMIAL